MTLIANTRQQQPLELHLRAVGGVAQAVAEFLRPDHLGIQKASYWGGRMHDIGKGDPGLQAHFNNIIAQQKDYDPDQGEHDPDKTLILAHHQWSYIVAHLIKDQMSAELQSGSIESTGSSYSFNGFDAALFGIFYHHSFPIDLKDIELKVECLSDESKHAFVKNINGLLLDAGIKATVSIESLLDPAYLSMANQQDSPLFIAFNPHNPVRSSHRNADLHTVRACVVLADRAVSGLSCEALDELVKAGTYKQFVLNHVLQPYDDVRLRQDILAYKNQDNLDVERAKVQETAALEFFEKQKCMLAAAPATGKTRMSLLTYLNTPEEAPVKGIMWVCPRVVVCESVLDELGQCLPNSRLSIVTGNHKAVYANGIEIEDADYYDADIIITTIDHVASSIVAHGKADNLRTLFTRFVVFDEYHEFISLPLILPVFMALVNLLKSAVSDSAPIRMLLVSGSPNFEFIKHCHSDYAVGRMDDHCVKVPSFNEKALKLSTLEIEKDCFPSIERDQLLIMNNKRNFMGCFVDGLKNNVLNVGRDHIYHSSMTANDRHDRHSTIVDVFGKYSDSDGTLVSGPTAQASLNISRKHGMVELSTPENTLQRAGRVNRFGVHEESSFQVFVLEEKLTKHKSEYSGEVDDCGKKLNALFYYALQALEDSIVNFNDLYRVYFDFYSAEEYVCLAIAALKVIGLTNHAEVRSAIKYAQHEKQRLVFEETSKALTIAGNLRPKKAMTSTGDPSQLSFRGNSFYATAIVEDIKYESTSSSLLPDTITDQEALNAFDAGSLVTVSKHDIDQSECPRLIKDRFGKFKVYSEIRNKSKHGNYGISEFDYFCIHARNPNSDRFLPLVLSHDGKGSLRYIKYNGYVIGLKGDNDE